MVATVGCGGGTTVDDTAPTDDIGTSAPVDMATPPDCPLQCQGPLPYCAPTRQCVACLTDDHCAAGSVCKSYVCTPGCADDARCRAGKPGSTSICCGGQCTDGATDASNCGACGKACSGLHASSTCVGGTCVPGTCSTGWQDCNNNPADGCEANLHVDPKNCTGCGMACSFAHGLAACADGCYLTACNFGYDDCNGEVMDGCETSVAADPKNCGACGNACGAPPHAKASCVNAACQVTACDQGYTDCDANAQNGCETQTGSDAKNCGMCGNACPQGLICVNGGCTCQQCNIPNAKSKCVNNQCIFDGCLPGYSNCDNNDANGCEVATDSDAKNCGMCGNVCPQNTPACSGGKCTNIDLSGVFSQYNFAGRNVYIWKTPGPCVTLANYTKFCQQRGLNWWSPKSQADAQKLIDYAFALDGTHTWIQVFGLATALGNGNSATMGGFQVTVDSGNCEQATDGSAFGAIRKWACSMCDPQRSDRDQNNDQSCCWDKGHPYDWFVCE